MSGNGEEMVTVIEVYSRQSDGSIEKRQFLGGGCEECARVYGSPVEARCELCLGLDAGWQSAEC